MHVQLLDLSGSWFHLSVKGIDVPRANSNKARESIFREVFICVCVYVCVCVCVCVHAVDPGGFREVGQTKTGLELHEFSFSWQVTIRHRV